MIADITAFFVLVLVLSTVDAYILWNKQDAFRIFLAASLNFLGLLGYSIAREVAKAKNQDALSRDRSGRFRTRPDPHDSQVKDCRSRCAAQP